MGLTPDPLEDRLLREVPTREGYKVLGPCILYHVIGKGGMGTVYQGHHVRLGVDVAVKCLSAELTERGGAFLTRFEREAQTAAALNHPNVVRVFDVDRDCGIPFIVMELVEGESVADRVARKGALELEEAIQITLGAAGGLAAAHAKGLVHRDIKPDNILVSNEGVVKVADLGLVKPDGSEGSSLTATGVVMGTPQYMPPEQFKSSRDVGAPADVYALGATLYFLLTGEHGVPAGSLYEVVAHVQNEPFPDLRERLPATPAPLAELVARCTSKHVEERPRDAEELGALLAPMSRAADSLLLDDTADRSPSGASLVSPPPAKTLARIQLSMRVGASGAEDAQEEIPEPDEVDAERASSSAPARRYAPAIGLASIVLTLAAVWFARDSFSALATSETAEAGEAGVDSAPAPVTEPPTSESATDDRVARVHAATTRLAQLDPCASSDEALEMELSALGLTGELGQLRAQQTADDEAHRRVDELGAALAGCDLGALERATATAASPFPEVTGPLCERTLEALEDARARAGTWGETLRAEASLRDDIERRLSVPGPLAELLRVGEALAARHTTPGPACLAAERSRALARIVEHLTNDVAEAPLGRVLETCRWLDRLPQGAVSEASLGAFLAALHGALEGARPLGSGLETTRAFLAPLARYLSTTDRPSERRAAVTLALSTWEERTRVAHGDAGEAERDAALYTYASLRDAHDPGPVRDALERLLTELLAPLLRPLDEVRTPEDLFAAAARLAPELAPLSGTNALRSAVAEVRETSARLLAAARAPARFSDLDGTDLVRELRALEQHVEEMPPGIDPALRDVLVESAARWRALKADVARRDLSALMDKVRFEGQRTLDSPFKAILRFADAEEELLANVLKREAMIQKLQAIDRWSNADFNELKTCEHSLAQLDVRAAAPVWYDGHDARHWAAYMQAELCAFLGETYESSSERSDRRRAAQYLEDAAELRRFLESEGSPLARSLGTKIHLQWPDLRPLDPRKRDEAPR